MTAYLHLEILVPIPLSFLLYADREGKCSALVGLYQLMPVVHLKRSIISLHMQFSALTAFHYDIHAVGFLFRIKVQWSDACGDGHIDIVRIDRRHFIYLDCILYFLLASGQYGCQ